MTAAGTPRPAGPPRWPDWLRWGGCFIVVLALHATAAAGLLRNWQSADEPVAGGPPIVIDLAPVAAAPETLASDVAPAPQQAQPQAEPVEKPEPEPDKPAVTASITPPNEPPPPKPEPPAPPLDTPPLPETPPAFADVVLPPARPHIPHPQPHEQRHRRVASLDSAPPKTERTARRAVAPTPGAGSHDPNAAARWKTELVARLQRFTGEAVARGEEGVARLAFSVDRSGRVHNARIVRSSGSNLLDRATLDLIARAAPLPPPPPEVHGAEIPIVVPINFNLR